MAYGVHMSRDKISTRIVRAEEKVVTLYITAGTAAFTKLTTSDNIKALSVSGITMFANDVSVSNSITVSNDITVADKVKALAVTGITVTARDVRAETSFIIPTCITGAYRTPFTDAQMFVDEHEKLLYVVVGATLMLLTLKPM